jgi:hypothetical protein
MRKTIILRSTLCALGLFAAACGDDDAAAGSGSVAISLEAEETITDGLEPGSDLENIKDGWSVRYDRFLITVGNVVAKSSDDASEVSQKKIYLLDLTKLPQAGFTLLDEEDVDAVRYDQVSFSSPVAKDTFARGPSVSEDDLAMMVDNGWSIYLEGQIEKPDGESCPNGGANDCKVEKKVRFAWGADAATNYTHCGGDTDLGFAVTSGGTATHNFTIHGDHWFFNSFPEGVEIVDRLAQWVADSDLDQDGETTVAELQATQAADVFPSSKGYSLSGSPIPITTAYDFLVAQAHTIGHFDGEGECEWQVK